MLLLVGGDSEIGGTTLAHLRGRGHDVLATTRHPAATSDLIPLDLKAPLNSWTPPPQTQAVCIFAAVARLADCAADPRGSAHVNVTQTLALAERLIARDIYVLFLSTNQVFDGQTAHVPADTAMAPVSKYGRQKARTESALHTYMARGAPVAILRLGKVVSPQTALLRDWRAALCADRPIRAFHDMTMAPAPIGAVTHAVERLMTDRAIGIFQLTGPRDVAYAEVGAFWPIA